MIVLKIYSTFFCF